MFLSPSVRENPAYWAAYAAKNHSVLLCDQPIRLLRWVLSTSTLSLVFWFYQKHWTNDILNKNLFKNGCLFQAVLILVVPTSPPCTTRSLESWWLTQTRVIPPPPVALTQAPLTATVADMKQVSQYVSKYRQINLWSNLWVSITWNLKSEFNSKEQKHL